MKSANQRKRPLTLDGYFGSQSSKRKKEKELNFASSADEERKLLKNEEPPTTSSNQPQRQQLLSKQEPSKSCERPDDRKQAKDEQKRGFNPKWRDELPWLNFNGDKNVMTSDICCKHSSVAGKTDFLKPVLISKKKRSKNMLPAMVTSVPERSPLQKKKQLKKARYSKLSQR